MGTTTSNGKERAGKRNDWPVQRLDHGYEYNLTTKRTPGSPTPTALWAENFETMKPLNGELLQMNFFNSDSSEFTPMGTTPGRNQYPGEMPVFQRTTTGLTDSCEGSYSDGDTTTKGGDEGIIINYDSQDTNFGDNEGFVDDVDGISDDSRDSVGGGALEENSSNSGIYDLEDEERDKVGHLPFMPPNVAHQEEDDSEDTSTYVQRRSEVRTLRSQGVFAVGSPTDGKILRKLRGELREDEDILDRYESVLQANPREYHLHTQLGTMLLDRYVRREEYLKDFPNTVKDPNPILKKTLKKHKAAQAVILKHFQLALAGNPDDGCAHAQIARILSDFFHLYDTARRHYERALEIFPTDHQSHIRFADLVNEQFGNSKEAIIHYQKALELNFNDSITHMKIADLLSKRVETQDDAMAHYTDAINLRGLSAISSAHVYRQLARMLAAKQAIAQSLRHYADSIRADPNDTTTHIELVSVLESEGRYAEAAGHLVKILRKDATNVDVMIKLATILHKDCKTDDAIRWLLRAHEQAPEDSRPYAERSRILEHLKGYLAEINRDIRADLVEVHTKLKGDDSLTELQRDGLLTKKSRLLEAKQALTNHNLFLDREFLFLVENYAQSEDKAAQRDRIIARSEHLGLLQSRSPSPRTASTRSSTMKDNQLSQVPNLLNNLSDLPMVPPFFYQDNQDNATSPNKRFPHSTIGHYQVTSNGYLSS